MSFQQAAVTRDAIYIDFTFPLSYNNENSSFFLCLFIASAPDTGIKVHVSLNISVKIIIILRALSK